MQQGKITVSSLWQSGEGAGREDEGSRQGIRHGLDPKGDLQAPQNISQTPQPVNSTCSLESSPSNPAIPLAWCSWLLEMVTQPMLY